MKRLLALVLGLLALWMLAHWPVSTRQGIDYRVRAICVPLYVKVIEFLARDYHYGRLAMEITAGAASDVEKARAIFRWMRERLYAGTPSGLPVVDDHIWHVILRGYGNDDQWADVFATLASYAGVPAAVQRLQSVGHQEKMSVALVRIDGRWMLVDPFRGYWFSDGEGVPIDVETVRLDPGAVARSVDAAEVKGVPYADYLAVIETPRRGSDGALRSARQVPWRRFGIEVTQQLDRFRAGTAAAWRAWVSATAVNGT